MCHSMFAAGNAGTGKSKVPADLHSGFLISHCKEIALVLAENILQDDDLCFRLLYGNMLFRPSSQPRGVQCQNSNVQFARNILYVVCKYQRKINCGSK